MADRSMHVRSAMASDSYTARNIRRQRAARERNAIAAPAGPRTVADDVTADLEVALSRQRRSPVDAGCARCRACGCLCASAAYTTIEAGDLWWALKILFYVVAFISLPVWLPGAMSLLLNVGELTENVARDVLGVQPSSS